MLTAVCWVWASLYVFATVQEESIFITSILQMKKLSLKRLVTHPRSHWEGQGWGVSYGSLALHPLHLATRPHSFRQRVKQGNVREWLMGTMFDRLTEGLPEWHVTYERWMERAPHENINRRMFLELLWFRIKTPCSKKGNNILKSTTLNIQD